MEKGRSIHHFIKTFCLNTAVSSGVLTGWMLLCLSGYSVRKQNVSSQVSVRSVHKGAIELTTMNLHEKNDSDFVTDALRDHL